MRRKCDYDNVGVASVRALFEVRHSYEQALALVVIKNARAGGRADPDGAKN